MITTPQHVTEALNKTAEHPDWQDYHFRRGVLKYFSLVAEFVLDTSMIPPKMFGVQRKMQAGFDHARDTLENVHQQDREEEHHQWEDPFINSLRTPSCFKGAPKPTFHQPKVAMRELLDEYCDAIPRADLHQILDSEYERLVNQLYKKDEPLSLLDDVATERGIYRMYLAIKTAITEENHQ